VLRASPALKVVSRSSPLSRSRSFFSPIPSIPFSTLSTYTTLSSSTSVRLLVLSLSSSNIPISADITALKNSDWGEHHRPYPPCCFLVDHIYVSVFDTGTHVHAFRIKTHDPAVPCSSSIDSMYPKPSHISISTYIPQGIIATLVQLFYAWRVKVLTGKLWLVALIVACALTGFCESSLSEKQSLISFPLLVVGALATGIAVSRIPQFIHFRDFKSVVIIWLAAECVGDVIITASLVLFLVRPSLNSSWYGTHILSGEAQARAHQEYIRSH